MSGDTSGTSPRRGTLALIPSQCTSCMICAQECPAWCITIDAHAEQVSEPGARRPRSVSVLDQFTIDFGLCMYCGICVDVCPFDALEWVPEATSVEATRGLMLHDLDRLAAPPPTAGRSPTGS